MSTDVHAEKTELPAAISPADRTLLIKMGVVFGDRVPNDPIFQFATLPEGWTIAPTSHSMWSNLLDNRGAKRAAIFYRAAFYDRSARLSVEPRFAVDTQYPCPPIGSPRIATITDAETGETLFTASEIVPDPTYKSNPGALCRAWLDEHRPEHKINYGWTIPTPPPPEQDDPMKKPRKYTLGLQTILFDRGMTKIEKEIDGITFTATVPLPNVYHFATANEGDFYLLSDGSKAPGTDADLAAEFAAAEPAKRAPKD